MAMQSTPYQDEFFQIIYKDGSFATNLTVDHIFAMDLIDVVKIEAVNVTVNVMDITPLWLGRPQ